MTRKQWRMLVTQAKDGIYPQSEYASRIQQLSWHTIDWLQKPVRFRARSEVYVKRLDFIMRYHGGPIPFFTDRFVYVGSNHL